MNNVNLGGNLSIKTSSGKTFVRLPMRAEIALLPLNDGKLTEGAASLHPNSLSMMTYFGW